METGRPCTGGRTPALRRSGAAFRTDGASAQRNGRRNAPRFPEAARGTASVGRIRWVAMKLTPKRLGHPTMPSGGPARARQSRRPPRLGQGQLPDRPEDLGGRRPSEWIVRLDWKQLPMTDQALVLFTAFDDSINYYTRHVAAEVRKIVSAQALTPEQQEALNVALRSALQSFTWSLLCPFDNVGCSLPDGVSGYSILARAFDPAKPGKYEPLSEVDIREDAEDYADMWQDFISARTSAD